MQVKTIIILELDTIILYFVKFNYLGVIGKLLYTFNPVLVPILAVLLASSSRFCCSLCMRLTRSGFLIPRLSCSLKRFSAAAACCSRTIA